MRFSRQAVATPAQPVTDEVETSVCGNVLSFSSLQDMWSQFDARCMMQGFLQQAGLLSATMPVMRRAPVATYPPHPGLNDDSELTLLPLLVQPMSVSRDRKRCENMPILSQLKRVRVCSLPRSDSTLSGCDFTQASLAYRDTLFYVAGDDVPVGAVPCTQICAISLTALFPMQTREGSVSNSLSKYVGIAENC